MRVKLRLMVIIVGVFILSGCGLTEEEALQEIEETVVTTFETNYEEPNQTFNSFAMFLPEQFTVVEESESNLIIEGNNQMFILFYNTLEDQTSDFFYLSAEATDTYTLLESYETDEQFSYVSVTGADEDYELQVGVGGVRITTQTDLKKLEANFTDMVTMLNSIEFTE
ncbi:hypothetical protein SAMN04488134_11414 [Amphibacillus marinus]|uniref:Uncharacterized protein n=1 Tax=Amphibacillus marinus TaxID=872970 RepID=A0A1H8T092_9BACI|nr:hypothetical protein [Amphibacillus marinus]SEO83994.1 hypothetical protein SAMN04488134_11414 [Amphibacillus marinus]